MKILAVLSAICSIAATAIASPPPIARWVELPGMPLEHGEIRAAHIDGISHVEINGERFEFDSLGYATVPLDPNGSNVATVVSNTGTTRDLVLNCQTPAETREVFNQPELDQAIAEMTDGGVIELAGSGFWEYKNWPHNNGLDWIEIRGDGDDTIAGVTEKNTQHDRIRFANVEISVRNNGQFYPAPGKNIAFVDCTIDGRIGDRWLRNAHPSGEGQRYWFKRCRLIESTYGFTDATLAADIHIETLYGDAMQHAEACIRWHIENFVQLGSSPHHKDLHQFFYWLVVNYIVSDIYIENAENVQGFCFFEDNFKLYPTYPVDDRVDPPVRRDYYEYRDLLFSRVRFNNTTAKYAVPQCHGRFYHFIVEDYVCPGQGWRFGNTGLNGFVGEDFAVRRCAVAYVTDDRQNHSKSISEIPDGRHEQIAVWKRPGDEADGFVAASDLASAVLASGARMPSAPVLTPKPPPDLGGGGSEPGEPFEPDPRVDVTTQGASIGMVGYGEPDGMVSSADLNFLINLYTTEYERQASHP